MEARRKVKETEVTLIRKGLSKYGRRAYKTSLAEGNNTTVLRGNSILTVTPDGEQVKIASVLQTRTKVTQRKFKLKK